MSTALYRKYRPSTFSDIIGQDGVINVLKNQIKENKISHAYIFSGTRGTGKTSTAKVFSKSINCHNYTDEHSLCNECESCKNINIDIFEIDAASNNSVENIRNLKDTIMYQPSYGKYKVYIIDEVHMLSTGAFNALLKTLEEPPSHIIFILATTEPNKIPSTILSRCQKFEFKKVSNEDIKSRLIYILEKEHIQYELQAIEYIANISDGGLRDAISMIDQISSYGKIDMQNVDFITGSSSINQVDCYINAIFEKNVLDSLTSIKDMMQESIDIKKIPFQVISRLLQLIYLKNNVDLDDILERDNLKNLIEKSKDIDITQLIIDFSELENKMKYSVSADILLQSFTVKQCKFSKSPDTYDIQSIIKKIQYLEDKIENIEKNGITENTQNKAEEKQDNKQEKKKNLDLKEIKKQDNISDEEKENINLVNSLLVDIHSLLKQKKYANISAFLHEGNIRRIIENNIYISYSITHSFHKKMIEKSESVSILENTFTTILDKPTNVFIVFDEEIISQKEEKDKIQLLKEKVKELFEDVELEIID